MIFFFQLCVNIHDVCLCMIDSNVKCIFYVGHDLKSLKESLRGLMIGFESFMLPSPVEMCLYQPNFKKCGKMSVTSGYLDQF